MVWIKSYHTLAYVISKIYARLSPSCVTLNPSGTIIRVNALSGNSISRWIWAWIEFISLLPWVLLKVHLPLLLGRIVIAERYLIDSITSIAYTLNDPDFASSLVARLMLRLIPKNPILIYLNLNYRDVKNRRGDMADAEDFIEFQKSMYDKLSRYLRATNIDTTLRGVEETALIIRNLLPVNSIQKVCAHW